MRKYYLLTTVVILLLNCKNEREETLGKDELQKIEEASEKVEISFNFTTNETDVFKIMMNDIEVNELQKKNIQIFETVSPSTETETIRAVFDEGNVSKKIVISLGNKKVKTITIDKINVSFREKTIKISTPKEMTKFLKFNKYVTVDSTSKTLKTKKVDGKHNPTLTLSKRLFNQLNIK